MLFLLPTPLRCIYACIATKVVCGKTGYCKVQCILPAKQLDAHERAGQWRIGSARKYGDKAHGGKQVDGRAT